MSGFEKKDYLTAFTWTLQLLQTFQPKQLKKDKEEEEVFHGVVINPDTRLPSSGMFLEARFSAVTFQWSKRLPQTSHSVRGYLPHTKHRGKAQPVSGEQQLITQR